jgi:hypothetical protein
VFTPAGRLKMEGKDGRKQIYEPVQNGADAMKAAPGRIEVCHLVGAVEPCESVGPKPAGVSGSGQGPSCRQRPCYNNGLDQDSHVGMINFGSRAVTASRSAGCAVGGQSCRRAVSTAQCDLSEDYGPQ